MRRFAIAAGLCAAAAALAFASFRDQPSASAAAPFRLVQVGSGFSQPIYIVSPRGDSRRFVVEKTGRVRLLQNGRPGTVVLDLRSKVSGGGEQGLLSIAFHPDFARNGRFFANYTDTAGDTRITEHRLKKGSSKATSFRRELLKIDQPYPNHNGGQLEFGPDGMLYIGMGDGGAGGDPHGNGQRLDTLLGKLLRIDVDGKSAGKQYRVPSDNPFVRTKNARSEIYSYGLRNPWRFSFDRATGDLWIGDVGQGDWEEVDYVRKGKGRGVNFGWNTREGRHAFPGGNAPRGKLTGPVAEYSHDTGCSVTGGYVYRGKAVPALTGRYVYGDYCSLALWTLKPGGAPVDVSDAAKAAGVPNGTLASFGEDAAGELYLVSQGGSIYRFAAAS